MLFEWDEEKAAFNLTKHGVDFASATEAFADPFAMERFDPRSNAVGEARCLLTGTGAGALLTVVYTERGESLRIISARRATRREHDDYYIHNSQA